MPIYEYRCEACGHTLDALQKISDPPLSSCPECNAAALKRLISAPNFRLKGGGWYETDFKGDKERKRNLAEGAGKESANKTDSGGGEKSSGSDAGDKKPADKPKESTAKETKAATKSKGSGTEAA